MILSVDRETAFLASLLAAPTAAPRVRITGRTTSCRIDPVPAAARPALQQSALDELRSSETLASALVGSIDGVVSIVEVETGETWVSPQAEQIFGYSSEQMALRGFWRSLVIREDYERACDAWRNEAELDELRLEYRMRRADGAIVRIEERSRRIRGADGRPVRWIGVATDVTGRHRLAAAERERTAAEQRLGDMSRLARDILLLIDMQGRIVEANDAAVAAYGYTRPELLELTIGDLRAPETRPAMPGQLEQAARFEGVLFETIHMRKDGATFPVEVSSHVVAIDGDRHWQSVIRDVSELNVARDATQRAERLDALALLAAGVAHDFRNILYGIELIAGGLGRSAGMSEEQIRETTVIGDAVVHANALIAQLLDFAKPREAGGETLCVGSAIEGLVPVLERLLGPERRFDVDIEPHTGCAPIGRGSLEQVVINLLVNARDATPPGGSVSVSVRPRTVGPAGGQALPAADSWCEIAVADTGSGIDPAVIDRIFLPYFTTKGAAGTGLGLATCLGIVRAAGGDILVESVVGQGTTFRVLLPVTAPSATKAHTSTAGKDQASTAGRSAPAASAASAAAKAASIA